MPSHQTTVHSLRVLCRATHAPLFVACAALVCASWATAADHQQLPPAVLAAAKKSTVYLRVTLADERIVEGSGFFAGESNTIITTAHVLDMLKDDSVFPQRIEVVANGGTDKERSYLGEVVGIDPESDLAVLSVTANDLPPPLELASAGSLQETETVFILGFPFGSRLGKHITVSKSSVSSLRKNEAGMLDAIQVNGGVHPGNSGGPVIDAKGQVVGVAVASLGNTEIHFAIPGDTVQDFLGGRVASVLLGKPRQHRDQFVASVSVHLVDPANRISAVSMDYWLGTKGKPRPAGSSQPEALKGDTPRQSLSLHIEGGVAEGTWTIPVPAEGQVIWAQPRYVTKSGKKRWAMARIMHPAPPEEASSVAAGSKTEVSEDKRAAAEQKDLKSLEGNWKLVRREVSGSFEETEELKLELVIEDGKLTWARKGSETGLKAQVELDPTAAPPAIDLDFVRPRQQIERCLGIYRLQGDRLELCWNREDDKRPRKFTTRLSLGCGTVHETYQRIKD
jgi:uncharacterized protein (TIGR03067 family)